MDKKLSDYPGALTIQKGAPRVPSVLLVDNESRIRRLIRAYLENESFAVDEAEDGIEALQKTAVHAYDLIVLELLLPNMDGLDVCSLLRYRGVEAPIIIVSAVANEEKRIRGFEVGADDYVTKPFSPIELVMRIKTRIRRHSLKGTEGRKKQSLSFNGLVIQYDSRTVWCDGEKISLTLKEYELLSYLAQHPGQVLTRERLLQEIWRYPSTGYVRTVDTHIKRLREKIRHVSGRAAETIVTVRSVGYKMKF